MLKSDGSQARQGNDRLRMTNRRSIKVLMSSEGGLRTHMRIIDGKHEFVHFDPYGHRDGEKMTI
jgi:hypothetical protein